MYSPNSRGLTDYGELTARPGTPLNAGSGQKIQPEAAWRHSS